MMIDLSFDERIMICECIRFRKLAVQAELLGRDSEDFPDGMYEEFRIFLRCAPYLIDRLLAEPAEPDYEVEEASDSFPAFYQGGDLDDYERSISMIRTEDGCRE